MNRDKKLQWFYGQIIELRDELFYFAYSILRSVPESEDAVSSAIIKAHTYIDSLRDRSVAVSHSEERVLRHGKAAAAHSPD